MSRVEASVDPGSEEMGVEFPLVAMRWGVEQLLAKTSGGHERQALELMRGSPQRLCGRCGKHRLPEKGHSAPQHNSQTLEKVGGTTRTDVGPLQVPGGNLVFGGARMCSRCSCSSGYRVTSLPAPVALKRPGECPIPADWRIAAPESH